MGRCVQKKNGPCVRTQRPCQSKQSAILGRIYSLRHLLSLERDYYYSSIPSKVNCFFQLFPQILRFLRMELPDQTIVLLSAARREDPIHVVVEGLVKGQQIDLRLGKAQEVPQPP